MKLVVYYLNKAGIAADLQSLVSLVFFLLFVFIVYIVWKGNKKEYQEYGNLPLDDSLDNVNSQNKTQ
jgi:cbb3-type cytochrome oxidase subunit 3